jgi:release factor glutamine methyltransferase
MFNQLGYDLSRWDLARFKGRPASDTFSALGREWTLLPDVWPGSAPATVLFTSWLPYAEADSFLEVGCGAGVTAVVAALNQCSRVCALDINAMAVRTAEANAIRHGVDDRITFLVSDLFTGLPESDRFDVIYWNSPFVEAPADHRYEGGIDYAALDAGYRTHRRFFAEAGRHLTDGGRIYLGFSDTLGNPRQLHRIATDEGFESAVSRRETVRVTVDPATAPAGVGESGELDVDYVLYESRRPGHEGAG